MKTQPPISVARIRQVTALALLGLWVGCGLFCTGRSLAGGARCAPDAPAGASACCQHQKTPASSPDRGGEFPGAAGAACCDAVTKPAATTLLPPVSGTAAGDSAGLGVAGAGPLTPLPAPVFTNRLPADKPPLAPPVQLLDGPHFAHGPPARF